MSNVRIQACGAEGLEVNVVLGAQTRASHSVAAGDEMVLTVGGGQRLVVKSSQNVAPTAEPVIDEGVDVSPEPEVATDVVAEAAAALGIQSFTADSPLEVGEPMTNPFDDDAAV